MEKTQKSLLKYSGEPPLLAGQAGTNPLLTPVRRLPVLFCAVAAPKLDVTHVSAKRDSMPVLSFSVDPKSAKRIRAKARATSPSLSAYLRKAALGETDAGPVKITRGKHPVSGLPYNAARQASLVSDEQIFAALADFP